MIQRVLKSALPSFIFGLFILLTPFLSWSGEPRTETLNKAAQICSDPQTNEQMAAYCDLVFGYAKESALSQPGVVGKRILIGRCDVDSDCPADSKCDRGRCFQEIMNQGSCRSDFDCLFGEKCENSICVSSSSALSQ